MLQALRRRQEQDEEGFTLIELMVVVLIIAILLAIAIPTFLGARTRAQDRAAQSNLRNALTGEKTFYTDNQRYGSAAVAVTGDITALQGIEPAIKWTDTVATGTASAGLVGVAVADVNGPANTRDNVIVAAKSASGTCFYLMDESMTGTTVPPGTYYSISSSCTAPATGTTVVAGKATDGGAAAGKWGTTSF
jgi:type IV pilus assembly protein PilA